MEKAVSKVEKAVKSAPKAAANVAKEVKKEVKEMTDTVSLTESVNKVKATAETVNTQIKETASVIADNIMEMGQDIKEVATKSVKEVAEKVDFTQSVEKAKATAKKVNTEIMETATEIVSDIKEVTTKMAKEAMENINVTNRINSLKKTAMNANQFALETSEELIDSLAANGEKWQNVTEKAIKKGLKLAERQQNIMFSTLEAVKVQLGGSGVRFKKLFGRNAGKKKADVTIDDVVNA